MHLKRKPSRIPRIMFAAALVAVLPIAAAASPAPAKPAAPAGNSSIFQTDVIPAPCHPKIGRAHV